MGFFDRFFGSTTKTVPQPDITFGRYSDSYKSKEQYESWDKSLDEFEKGNFLESYKYFFAYLGDNKLKNVSVRQEKQTLFFEITQGSKKVTGVADRKKVKAQSKVARVDQLNIGFMRRLMEENFKMEYSRFALDEKNDIAIVFDTYVLDGSPYKLYYALKEVATKADKLDDLLIDEFDVLHETDVSLLHPATEEIKAIKYHFILRNIREVLDEIANGRLNKVQYPGGIAYLLLNLAYKLDYLTHPEGQLMETFERIHRQYFSKDGKSNIQKNADLEKEFEKILQYNKEEIFKELYNVTATFGITKPVTHDRVVSFIDGELHNMDWYLENDHYRVAMSIPGYIVGYCMFQYAVPKPVKDYFHLFYQVVEAAYFNELGFTLEYVNLESGSLNSTAIKRRIKIITEKNKEKYPGLKPNIGTLRFQSVPMFAKSYLMMIRDLDMTKLDWQ